MSHRSPTKTLYAAAKRIQLKQYLIDRMSIDAYHATAEHLAIVSRRPSYVEAFREARHPKRNDQRALFARCIHSRMTIVGQRHHLHQRYVHCG